MDVRNQLAVALALFLFAQVAAAQLRGYRGQPPPPPPPPPPNPDQLKPLEQTPTIRLPDVNRIDSNPTQGTPVQTQGGNQGLEQGGTQESIEGSATTQAEVPQHERDAEQVSKELKDSRSYDLEGLPVMGKLRRAHWP